jgi:hypothetical protein
MTKLIANNIFPLAVIGLCTAVGFLCGNAAYGFAIGGGIVCAATLFPILRKRR